MDHANLWENFWLVAGLSLGGGGFASQVAAVLHGDLGIGLKLVITVGVASIIFGTIYFFGATPHA